MAKKWKMFTGTIEVTIEAKTEEEAEERLKIFTEQVIKQNADVYTTRYVLPKELEEKFQDKMEKIIDEAKLFPKVKDICLILLRQGILWTWFKKVTKKDK